MGGCPWSGGLVGPTSYFLGGLVIKQPASTLKVCDPRQYIGIILELHILTHNTWSEINMHVLNVLDTTIDNAACMRGDVADDDEPRDDAPASSSSSDPPPAAERASLWFCSYAFCILSTSRLFRLIIGSPCIITSKNNITFDLFGARPPQTGKGNWRAPRPKAPCSTYLVMTLDFQLESNDARETTNLNSRMLLVCLNPSRHVTVCWVHTSIERSSEWLASVLTAS